MYNIYDPRYFKPFPHDWRHDLNGDASIKSLIHKGKVMYIKS